MRFSWTGLLLAPLLVPLLLGAAMAGFFGANSLVVGFSILLAPCFVISYGTTVLMFLPSVFLLSRRWRMTSFTVCLLGLALGALVFVLLTFFDWLSNSHDSGLPGESFFVYLAHWIADPWTAIFPISGLGTAALYWWIGTWRRVPAEHSRG